MNYLKQDDATDAALVRRAQNGDWSALEDLIRRYQPWILHLAQRMLWNREDAEDGAQEIFLKTLTRLGTFAHRSSFRTWIYRIAGNHLLDRCRAAKSFEAVAQSLNEMPDGDLPDPNSTHLETALLVEEAKIACTTGILLCLEPRQRLVFILGEILGVKDDVGGEILETSPANFRQMLSRTRRELYEFLQRQCGLVNRENDCRCERKVAGFIAKGWIRPEAPQFISERLVEIRAVAPDRYRELQELERLHADLFRQEPLLQPREQAVRLRELLTSAGVREGMGLDL